MTYMQIIDNFMPYEWWQNTHQTLDSDRFPWFLNKDTSYDNDNCPQMIHNYYRDNERCSNWFMMVQPLIFEFQRQTTYQLKDVYRIKSNLLFNRVISEEQKQKIIHQDMHEPNYISLLYYVHYSDGDTILYQDDKVTEAMRVTPKANRAVIFDSRIWHTAELPIKNQTRQVINCLFEIKDLQELNAKK